MKKIKIPYFEIISFCSDIILIPIIFILAYSVKFKIGWTFQHILNIPLGKVYEFAQIEPYLSILWLVIFLWILSFWFSKLYQFPASIMPEVDMIIRVVQGVTIATIELMALSFIYKSFPGSRYVIFYAWLFGIGILCAARFFIFKVVLKTRRFEIKNALVIGADEFGQDVVERILLNPSLGLKYIGTIANQDPPKTHFHLRNRFKLIGNFQEIEKILASKDVQVVFVSDKHAILNQLDQLVEMCEKKKIEIKILSELVHHQASICYTQSFDSLPFEVHEPITIPITYYTVKRLFDIVFSSVCLMLCIPLFSIIALLIKISSPQGPIFYVQERVGEKNRIFGMIKFRTMIPSAEDESGPVMVNEKKEDRCIPLGKFFRTTSIDELPQLWNVLKGDMSIIGPRPERPFFVEKFEKEIPYFRLRHVIKGGITGWAQVNGRSVLTRNPAHKLKYDLYYIQNWSLLFDIKILIKTFFIVLKKEEAY